jgi:hypothetical protein
MTDIIAMILGIATKEQLQEMVLELRQDNMFLRGRLKKLEANAISPPTALPACVLCNGTGVAFAQETQNCSDAPIAMVCEECYKDPSEFRE